MGVNLIKIGRIISKLEEFYQSDESCIDFTFLTNLRSFIIYLHEHEDFGFEIEIFNSCDNYFTGKAESDYAHNIITYEDAVVQQCINNINKIASKFEVLSNKNRK